MSNVLWGKAQLNRKSELGSRPSLREPPPHGPGRPWFTVPPTSLPEPQFIEYAVSYRNELIAAKDGAGARKRCQLNDLLALVNAWIKAANILMNQRYDGNHGDLCTTDGLIVAASRELGKLMAEVAKAGGVLDGRTQEVRDALRAKSDEIRRRQASKA
jgi:hypothetical protein